MRTRIGPERLSVARLEREAAEAGAGGDVMARDIYLLRRAARGSAALHRSAAAPGRLASAWRRCVL
eukprot:scaffold199894_cov21-Tisochrysis_lutea.AAC.1